MIEEAREIAAIHKNMVVKIPMTAEGLKAVSCLTKEGIRIGSSLKDVTKKYGKAKARFGVYTFKKGSSKLQIMLNGNKVSAIRYFASK